MKHVNLDTQDASVKQFVLSLQLDHDGSVLEADGKPVARVLPIDDDVAAIAAGIEDMEAGRVVPFEEVDARIRQKLGLPARA